MSKPFRSKHPNALQAAFTSLDAHFTPDQAPGTDIVNNPQFSPFHLANFPKPPYDFY
jgi:hypothetical protein